MLQAASGIEGGVGCSLERGVIERMIAEQAAAQGVTVELPQADGGGDGV